MTTIKVVPASPQHAGGGAPPGPVKHAPIFAAPTFASAETAEEKAARGAWKQKKEVHQKRINHLVNTRNITRERAYKVLPSESTPITKDLSDMFRDLDLSIALPENAAYTQMAVEYTPGAEARFASGLTCPDCQAKFEYLGQLTDHEVNVHNKRRAPARSYEETYMPKMEHNQSRARKCIMLHLCCICAACGYVAKNGFHPVDLTRTACERVTAFVKRNGGKKIARSYRGCKESMGKRWDRWVDWLRFQGL
jgi:hypothetical protein